MDKGTLLSQLEKFRQGQCTAEEQALLHAWLDVLAADEQEQLTPLSADAMQQIKAKTLQRVIRTKAWYNRPWVSAAAIALPLALSTLFLIKHRPPHTIAMRTVTNNSQVMKRLRLPDSSTVLLGPYATIQFPEQFNDKERPVKLKAGKAFFATVTDAERPFSVEDGSGAKTTVLGTSFTIETNQYFSRVAVATGKVSVTHNGTAPTILTPAQRVTISNNHYTRDSIATSDLLAWTKGQIVLRNASLQELLLTIQNQYGIKATTNMDVHQGNYTLRFPAAMSLAEVLDIIHRISYKPKIHFIMQNNQVQVLPVAE